MEDVRDSDGDELTEELERAGEEDILIDVVVSMIGRKLSARDQ